MRVPTKEGNEKMKKLLVAMVSLVLVLGLFTGCQGGGAANINVISREDGSGTRGAFIELTGVEEKGEDGTKTDMTTADAVIVNKTDVMLVSVAGDEDAIGYVSLGSLNDTVKAVQVDGVAPTTDSVKDGSYAIARPFNIAVKGEPTPLAQDLIDFILSAEGQAIVAEDYVTIADDAPAFAGALPAVSYTHLTLPTKRRV